MLIIGCISTLALTVSQSNGLRFSIPLAVHAIKPFIAAIYSGIVLFYISILRKILVVAVECLVD